MFGRSPRSAQLPGAALSGARLTDLDAEDLGAAIAALGEHSSRVHVHDPVDHAAMTGWYAAADVVLSTSRREGSGYALIEAMTEGCVPVVTGLPSHRSIVGGLVPTFAPGDVADAADLLVRAVGVARDTVREDAAARLSWAVVVEQLVGLYRQPVLLAHSYFLRLDPKQHAKMRPYPPLNTLHAATVLRLDGLDVAVFDSMLAEDESAFAESLERHRPSVVVLYEDNFNFLSKMCLTRMREAAVTMVGMALAAGCRVAVSGADVTDHPEVYLAAGAHACLLGEAEHTMREVVARWLGPDPQGALTDVDGLALLVDGEVVRTAKRSIE
eukprot:gene19687-39129_t